MMIKQMKKKKNRYQQKLQSQKKKIAELKLKLNLGEKTDYKNQKKRELGKPKN